MAMYETVWEFGNYCSKACYNFGRDRQLWYGQIDH